MPKPPPPKLPPKPRGPPKPAAGPAPEPARPKGAPLEEVERALSILHGRHPEAVRAERETMAALQARRAATDQSAGQVALLERRRWIRRIGAGVVIAGTLATLVSLYSRRAARGALIESALQPKIAPYLALGFSRVSPSRFAEETSEIASEESSCFVALAARSPGDGAVRVERPSGVLEGSDSIAWCTCGAERATARLGTGDSGGGLAILRIGAKEVGGDFGLFFLTPRANVIAHPDECSGDSLDAWVEQGHAPVHPNEAQPEPLGGKLFRSGFTAAASALGSLPFAVLPGVADTCALAWSATPEDSLSLRLPGGDRPVKGTKGALGFCTERAIHVTVWREGTGELVIERVPAARVGGTHGLRETASRLGFARHTEWVATSELAWDASRTIRASGVPPPEITVSADGRAVPHARILTASIAGAMVRADAQEGDYLCEPPLALGSESAFCVQRTALAWHVAGSVGQAGIAESAFPFWMGALVPVTDAAALEPELKVLALGRRLIAQGFEATSLEGVTETSDGALVTGRAGDDAIVAVQLTRDPPWVAPCGETGPWDIDSDTGVIALTAGAQVKLVCSVRQGAKDRRTVVFRHMANGVH